MSCSSSSRIPEGRDCPGSELRRRLVLGMTLAPLCAFAAANPKAGLQRWGSGEFRRLGFLVYEATLWAGDDPLRPPLALDLHYRRSIAGKVIARASVDEMRRLGADEASLTDWGEQMARLFPDVRDGDHILGLHRGDSARFLYNDHPLGEIADGDFARRFFAIWLDPQTRAPELRAALLRQSG